MTNEEQVESTEEKSQVESTESGSEGSSATEDQPEVDSLLGTEGNFKMSGDSEEEAKEETEGAKSSL